MKQNLIFALLISLFLTLAVFGQSKQSRLDEFLGKSTTTIQNIWGYPETTEITKEGYVKWSYTYQGNINRTFYFSGNYVEICGSSIILNDYNYAMQLTKELADGFISEGFWVYRSSGNTTTMTNGRVYIDVSILEYKNKYGFILLAYW